MQTREQKDRRLELRHGNGNGLGVAVANADADLLNTGLLGGSSGRTMELEKYVSIGDL
jgi:hypothetical protein